MKNNKGMNLITLSITIMLMILLSGITIYTGVNEVRKSEDRKEQAELGMVNQAVAERYFTYTTTRNVADLVGDKMSKQQVQDIASTMGIILISIPDSYNEAERAYYVLEPDTLEQIGIQASEDTYVVNYVTGEVINLTKQKTRSGQVLYTYSRAVFENNDEIAY